MGNAVRRLALWKSGGKVRAHGGRHCKARILAAGDVEQLFEVSGKLVDFIANFRWLLEERGQHARGDFGIQLDQFRRGNDQGQVPINIVAHGRELFIDRFDLFRAQGYWLCRQTHGGYDAGRRDERQADFGLIYAKGAFQAFGETAGRNACALRRGCRGGELLEERGVLGTARPTDKSQSGRGLPHSKTLARRRMRFTQNGVLGTGRPVKV